MIKLIQRDLIPNNQIETDSFFASDPSTGPYLPFSIKIENSSSPFYWRVIDNFHIFEVCLDKKTGKLMSITLTLFNDNVKQIKDRMINFSCKTGIPIFDLREFEAIGLDKKTKFIDNQGKFDVGLGITTMEIILSDDDISNGIRINDRIYLLFNDAKEFSKILVTHINETEMDVIHSLLVKR